MAHQATKAEIDAVVDRVHEIGLKTEISTGEERTLVGVIGGNAYAYKEAFSHLGGIHEIIPIPKPFKLASREFRPVDMPRAPRSCVAARSSRARRLTRSRAWANRRSR